MYGEKITVTTRFKLIPVRCPIMSVCRPVGKEVVVIMKSECRYKSYKKDREILLHKFNGVCQVHESELSGLFSLKRSNVDGSSAERERRSRRGHKFSHTNPQRKKECHIQSVIYHSELGVLIVCKGWRVTRYIAVIVG